MWDIGTVLNYLQAFVDKSGIVKELTTPGVLAASFVSLHMKTAALSALAWTPCVANAAIKWQGSVMSTLRPGSWTVHLPRRLHAHVLPSQNFSKTSSI